MIRVTSIFLFLILGLVTGNETTTPTQNMLQVARANDDFGYQLLHKLELEEKSSRGANGEPKNLFTSSFSIGAVLAMVMAGGVGQTAQEIKSTLGFGANITEAQLYSAYSALLDHLNSTTSTSNSTVKLQLANALALQNDYPLLPTYLNILNDHFNAAVFPANFKEKASEATQKINSWANEKTNGKIPKLFDDVLPDDTRLVLLNALYFKGAWKEPFSNWSTENKEFNYGTNQKVNVSMMHRFDDKIKYASFEEGELIELPYDGDRHSMLLFLPSESKASGGGSISSTFSKVLKGTSGEGVSGYAKLRIADINLALPRFQIQSTFKLKPTLQSMGITTAFDERTVDLSRMTGQRNLRLSEVVHKTFVKVNEEGSEAAAVTGAVVIRLLSARFTDPKTVNFNRSFLFAIRDNGKQLTLFAGVVNKP